jgi:hypothetical protein
MAESVIPIYLRLPSMPAISLFRPPATAMPVIQLRSLVLEDDGVLIQFSLVILLHLSPLSASCRCSPVPRARPNHLAANLGPSCRHIRVVRRFAHNLSLHVWAVRTSLRLVDHHGSATVSNSIVCSSICGHFPYCSLTKSFFLIVEHTRLFWYDYSRLGRHTR